MLASSKSTIQALQLGDPYPGRQHTLLAQIPTWQDMVSFGQGGQQTLAALNYGYPRSILHPDVCRLGSMVQAKLQQEGGEDRSVLLFSNAKMAMSCREYVVHLLLREGKSTQHDCPIELHSVDFSPLCQDNCNVFLPPIHAVLFPSEAFGLARVFWQRTGPGITSRLAKRCLQNLGDAQIMPFHSVPKHSSNPSYDATCGAIRSRIAGLVEGGAKPLNTRRRIASSDVFLYPSGMTAIYQVHELLLNWRGGASAHMGLLYEPTLKILESRGPGLLSYKLGTETDLDRFAAELELLSREGRPVQAVWCECPSNPLLQTVDFQRLRQLADQYDMALVVDDSIGSFANVDMLGVADIVITSLSKIFSGRANVMAGSVILNPNLPHWGEFHEKMTLFYQNDLFVDDAVQLEYNSRNFLDRVARVNSTTQYIIDKLAPLVADPSSPITWLFHPSLCSSRQFYDEQMRAPTDEFCPGYGGLFTIDFATVATAASFFDHLHVYKGFSFGADVCIATPYVQMTMKEGKDQAAQYGVQETIIRFSTGLEEPNEILERICTALEAADQVWAEGTRCQSS